MENNDLEKGFFSRKKIPLSLVIMIVCISGALGIFLSIRHETQTGTDTLVVSTITPADTVKLHRHVGKEFTKPLLITEIPGQSPSLFSIRQKISSYLDSNAVGNFSNVSVYLLKQNTSEWIGINHEKEYSSPGYLRISVLISILKLTEKNPQLLNKKIEYKGNPNSSNYSELTLTPGKAYTVQKLIEQMMLTQDTTPKFLLNPLLDKKEFIEFHESLGLNKPDLENQKFSITAAGYSKLLNVIYNGTYLNHANSEYVLKLLSNNNKREGILKFLPEKSKVIHKMSLRFANNQWQVRESGIIYDNNDSYVLTILISGTDKVLLENACGEIGKIVYDLLSGD